MPRHKPPRPALLLLLLPILLGACATKPLPPPTVPALIPPLPEAARQKHLPTYSERLQIDFEKWRQRLTPPSSPAVSAKPLSTI